MVGSCGIRSRGKSPRCKVDLWLQNVLDVFCLSKEPFPPSLVRNKLTLYLYLCRLFGFEGCLPIEQIEFLIFGDHKGRLRWHPFGSPLSRHRPDESWKGGHCDPVDPTTDPEVRAMVEAAKTSKLGDPKVYPHELKISP